MKFADFLKTTRKEMGLTQEQMGFELFQCQQNINNMEHGRRFPRIDEVEQIADRLGYEVMYVKKENNNATV